MIYVSSSCIKKKNIAKVIQELAENNISNIELSGGTDYYNGIEEDLSVLKQKYNLNYTCHAYFPPPQNPFVVNLAACNDEIYQQSINHYVHCIEMMKRLDCRILSIHAGFLIEISVDEIGKKLKCETVYDEDKAYDRFCTAYEQIAKMCLENGIDFYLENNVLNVASYEEFKEHNYMMMTDYDSIMKMKRQINFNFLLDLGHLYVSSNTLGRDYAQECEKLRKHVEWIHVSENNGICDEHKPLKKGSAILEEFYKMYAEPINVTVETVGSIEEILKGISLIKEKNT